MSIKVSALLKTGPILWIPSKIWFSFISRRLKVLNEVHGKLWKKMPTNYGVTSGLLAFLMQSVIFTPPKVNWYVREALAALNYKRNCDTFGMFFIPLVDADRPWLLNDIPEIDTVEVVRELGLTVTRRRKGQPERPEEEEEDETRYPLGEAPTWKQIAGSLQADPTVLIPRWEEPLDCERYTNCEPGSAESHAVDIFVSFTWHIWISLNPTWRTRPENSIKPTTLTAALRSWSVDAILGEVLETSFKPCHSGLEGGPGRPSVSFSQRRKMYFPEDGTTLTKVWMRFGGSPGYISKYHERRKRLDMESKRVLDECLEELLMLCQCLPDSSRSKSGGCIWRVEKKKIVILTNTKYYRLRRIGRVPSAGAKGKVQGLRAAPAHRNARSTAIAMMMHEEIPEEVARKAYQVTRSYGKRRSAKSRNRRKPPQKQKKVVEEEAEDEDSDDDDEEEDEGQDYGDDEDSEIDEEGEGDDEDSGDVDDEEF